MKMRRCEEEKMLRRRCEDEKMFYRPPLLEEPCAQTLSGIKLFSLNPGRHAQDEEVAALPQLFVLLPQL